MPNCPIFVDWLTAWPSRWPSLTGFLGFSLAFVAALSPATMNHRVLPPAPDAAVPLCPRPRNRSAGRNRRSERELNRGSAQPAIALLALLCLAIFVVCSWTTEVPDNAANSTTSADHQARQQDSTACGDAAPGNSPQSTHPLRTRRSIGKATPEKFGRNSAAIRRGAEKPAESLSLLAPLSGARTGLAELEKKASLWCAGALSLPEHDVLCDASDGRLDRWDFLSAVLVVGGTSSQELETWRCRLQTHIEKLQRTLQAKSTDSERLACVFAYLHQEILCGGYQLQATNLALALDEGRFNCVSATILFKLLADAVGLDVKFWQSPTHAFCRVQCGDSWVPVESTCPTWLESLAQHSRTRVDFTEGLAKIGSDPTASLPILRQKGVVGTAIDLVQTGREISETQMLGTIYYNRGVDALVSRQYEFALLANLWAVKLDAENRAAQDNLLASLNNWAITLAEQGRFAEGAERLQVALRYRPDSAAVQGNLYRVYREWTSAKQDDCSSEELSQIVRDAIRSLPDVPQCDSLREKLSQLTQPPR